MAIFYKQRSAAKPARKEGAMKRLLMNVAGSLKRVIALSGEVDLGEFPDLLDEEKVATFYEACLEVFPGQQDICLPSGTADMLLKSQPPVKAVLRLIERLYRDRPETLSIRLPRGRSSQPHSSIVLHFV